MDWKTVYGAQDDSLEGMLARGQVNDSAMMQVARELEQRKQADRSFGLQEENARENRAFRESQQKSLDDDRRMRAEDRDENRKVAKTGRFLATLPLRKKGDAITGPERVQFAEEGMNGLATPAGPDAHEQGPHFHFAGTAAQEDADARQSAADKESQRRADHDAAMEKIGMINATKPSGGHEGLTPYQESQLTTKLRGDYNKVSSDVRTMQQQRAMMDAGLAEARKGNMNAATQAVISTFNKILDPNSVVRESEYDRSPEGMALKQRMQGFLPKLTQGGIGMTPEALEQFAGLAREFTARKEQALGAMVRPIMGQADKYGIDRSFIMDGGGQPAAPAGAAPSPVATSVGSGGQAPAAAAPAAPGGAPTVGAMKKFPNGKTGTWDGKGWRLTGG